MYEPELAVLAGAGDEPRTVGLYFGVALAVLVGVAPGDLKSSFSEEIFPCTCK